MSMSVDFLVVQRALRAWVANGSGLPLDSVYWGQQDSKRVAEPAIEMRIIALHTIGQAWVDEETAYVIIPAVEASASLSSNTLTAVAHGYNTGDGPFFLNGSGSISPSKTFWIIRLDANTFQVADSYEQTGGVDIAGSPSGKLVTPFTLPETETLTIVSTPKTLRAGQELRYVSRAIERLELFLECHTSDAVGMGAAVSILSKVKSRQGLASQQAILRAARLGLIDVERVRAIHGMRNAVMFEPRAIMEIYFSMPTEEEEFDQIIQRVATPSLDVGQTGT